MVFKWGNQNISIFTLLVFILLRALISLHSLFINLRGVSDGGALLFHTVTRAVPSA